MEGALCLHGKGDTVMGSESDKTTTKSPAWYEDAAKKALAQGEKTAKIGYVPYSGPDVAAFSPQIVDAMQQSADWSAAFNTPGQAAPNIASQIMPATDFGGGLKGYSSFGGFEDSVAALRSKFPGLASYLDSFFVNPTTGKYPGSPAGGIGGDPVTPPPVTPPPVTPPPGGGGGGGGGTGGPPPPGQRVPGMRGRLPNGGTWKINAKGQLVTYAPTGNLGFGGEGGKGNYAESHRGEARNIHGGYGPAQL